ncbi:MAG: flagellar biosynthesis protein FlhF [Bdellovibrionota bacterium]
MGMQIKKFQASSLQKALEQIRAELGDGAIVLQADPIKTGLFGRHGVEVTAAIDRKTMPARFEIQVDDESPVNSVARSTKKSRNKSWSSLFKGRSEKSDEKKNEAGDTKTNQIKNFVSQAVQTEKREEAPGRGQLFAMKTFVDPLKEEIQQLKQQMKQERPKSQERIPSSSYLESEIQDLKNAFKDFVIEQKLQDSELPAELKRLEVFWRDHGVTTKQIARFFNQLKEENRQFDEEFLKSALQLKVKDSKVFESRAKKIKILVGPTGVGKTTTIAKLAAFEKLKLKRSVSLITIDDFKIGGTDQLGHYARILEAPFVKCRSDVSLEDQIKSVEADTIFIDTFGVSPKDDAKILKLRKALQLKDPELIARQELHLALPAGLASGDVDLFVESFSRMNPHYLLFTKWDETENWGGMLAAIMTSERPVSFVGHGQEVPDDISVFNSEQFIQTVTTWGN